MLASKEFQAVIKSSQDYITVIDALLSNIAQSSEHYWLEQTQMPEVSQLRSMHWNREVRGLTYFVLKHYSQLLGSKVYTQICETF